MIEVRSQIPSKSWYSGEGFGYGDELSERPFDWRKALEHG